MRWSLPAQVLPSSYDLPSHHRRRGPNALSSFLSLTGALTTIYLVAYTYYHYVSSRDPTSYFFDKTHAYKLKYSVHREAQADAFIASIDADAIIPKVGSSPPRVCVGIATVLRRGRQYVSTTVGSLLEGLSAAQRSTMFLNVLIAHSDPAKHPNANDVWMQTLADRVLKYNQDGKEFEQILKWEDGGWYRNKTIFDYTYLLKDCYDTGAQYIAMFEDDTLAARGWYGNALTALEEVSTQMEAQTASRWAYLRLFYVEDLLGWNSEQWLTYLFWSLTAWTVATAGMLYARHINVRYFNCLPQRAIVLLSTFFTALYITLFFMAGRQTVAPIATGIQKMNKYGCCSQALVFPREIVPIILERSDLTTDWLVDMMIEQISDKEQLERWVTVPALFQHIGTTSSKGYGFDDNARELWNFRFEDHKIP